jgi:hypothetical protein
MTALSPMGAETPLLPTVAAVGGVGALVVPERSEGESLFASMVTGALVSMHGDGVLQPPSSASEAALVVLPVQVSESSGWVVNGEVYPVPAIENCRFSNQRFRAVESPVGSDLRPSLALSHTARWGQRWGDCPTPKSAGDSEPSFGANHESKEDPTEEVASGESSLRISENGWMPTWVPVPGTSPPWIPQVMPSEAQSSPAPGSSEGSEPSSTLDPSGRMLSPQAGHGISLTPLPQSPSSGGKSSAQPAFLRQPAEWVRTGKETNQVSTTPVAVDTTTRETSAVAPRFQGQGPESGWQRVAQEIPRPDTTRPTSPASRGSRSDWKTSPSPSPYSVGSAAVTGEPPSALAASIELSGESPSASSVQWITGSSEAPQDGLLRWGSAAAGRWRSIASPGAMPETVTPMSEPAAKKDLPWQRGLTDAGEANGWVPEIIRQSASGSGGQPFETALSAARDGVMEDFSSEAVGDLKMPEETKTFPQPTNLPPSRSADIAYGGAGEVADDVLLGKGVGSESNSDKPPENPEKKAFYAPATTVGKGGNTEGELPRIRSGMTHARADVAMASDRFQTSVPKTAPQRRGVGALDSALDSESVGSLSVARGADSSMGMPPLAPTISEPNRFPETAEGGALPQARSVVRLSDQLSGEVILLQRLRTESMTAVLRPDAGSELRVDLRRRDGRIEIRATLERGDAQAIAEGWPELQQQLRAQGVHLLPLEREVPADSSKAPSDPMSERSAHSGGRGRNQQPSQDSAPAMGGEAGQKAQSHPARSAPSAALKPTQRPLLESWA